MKSFWIALTATFMSFGTMLWGQTPTFESLRQSAPNMALGLAYVQGNKDPVIHAEGPLAKDSDQHVGIDARWHIGSITKSITSTLVMQQVDQGTLDIHAPIGEYLHRFDNIHADMQKLTLYQLMSHTSGLRPNPAIKHFAQLRHLDPVEGRHRVLADFWNSPPKSEPGNHVYSNLGYMLIGVILEEVTGRSWETLVQENVAGPLGLNTIGFGAPPGANDPQGHRNFIIRSKPVASSDPAADNPAWLGPAGTIHMSLMDLLRYGQAHLAACKGNLPDFLSEESCAKQCHSTNRRKIRRMR